MAGQSEDRLVNWQAYKKQHFSAFLKLYVILCVFTILTFSTGDYVHGVVIGSSVLYSTAALYPRIKRIREVYLFGHPATAKVIERKKSFLFGNHVIIEAEFRATKYKGIYRPVKRKPFPAIGDEIPVFVYEKYTNLILPEQINHSCNSAEETNMAEGKDWNAVKPVPELDWRAERMRMWRHVAKYLAFFVAGCFLSLFVDSSVFVYALIWGCTVILMIWLHFLIRLNVTIIRYGKKYPAKILSLSPIGEGMQGKVDIYLSADKRIKANFKIPADKPKGHYSNILYEWPKEGDIISVYFWNEIPKHVVAIWDQFKK